MARLSELGDGLFITRFAKDFPVRDRLIVEIDADATLNTAFSQLAVHNILAAPVWDSTQNGYLGLLDVEDFLNLVLDIDFYASTASTGKQAAEFQAGLKTSEVKVVDLFVPANRIRNPARVPLWVPVGPNAPMKDVLPILASPGVVAGGVGARVVPVVDPTSGKIIKIISQMDVVRALHTCFSIMKDPSKQAPAPFRDQDSPAEYDPSLGFLRKVVTVDEETEARDIFRAMIDADETAVGITEKSSGAVIGIVTNKDVQIVVKNALESHQPIHRTGASTSSGPRQRGRLSIATSTLGKEDFFSMPAMTFCVEVRKRVEGLKTRAAVSEDLPTASFRHLVGKMANSGMHRVFLVDEEKRPIGVFSVGDCCNLVVKVLADEAKPPKASPPPLPKRSTAGEVAASAEEAAPATE